jgi:hypothetical protein
MSLKRFLHFAKVYLHSVEGAGWPVKTPWSHLVGSPITCSGEGCVGPGLSLACTAWLRLRCNTRPIKEVGELTVCSSHSRENYWNMVEPRFQPLRGRGYFPASNLCLRSGLSVPTPCVFHRCSLSFAGVISRKRHDLRPGRTRVTQKRLCRRCRVFVEPE